MINCTISPIGALYAQLTIGQLIATDNSEKFDLGTIVQDVDVEHIKGWLRVAQTLADDFELEPVLERIRLIQRRLERPTLWRDVATEYRVLRETLDAGLKWQLIYRYPKSKSQTLTNWQADWKLVLEKFPSTRADIIAAVDLWALDHSTAAIFHCMRILEHGLRALAIDVGREFSVQNWQNILDQIESEIRTQGKSMRSGNARGERLQFLAEAAKEFSYFKDGWRNYVAHGRASYDPNQARTVLEHVKSFMTTLASRLHENPAPNVDTPGIG